MIPVLSLLLMTAWLLFWLPLVTIAYLLKKKELRALFSRWACRGLLFFCHVRVKTIGEPSAQRPLLLVSNHLSYLDIPVLASVVDCRFVPKKEIAKWPVINLFCKIMDVVYIDRSAGKISEGNAAIQSMLAGGEIVVLFPEATTGDGKRLLPFKPAFFEAANGATVQPVAIAYRRIRGLPIDYGQWPNIAWYGDMVLLPHLWKLLGLGKIEVELHFLPPIPAIGADRKELAIQSHSSVETALLGKS